MRIKKNKFSHIIFMQGRILTIKKSSWLTLSLILNVFFFIVCSLLSFALFNQYNYWFFFFCFFIGLHLILKSMMFKFDSCCYFGILLFFIGFFYFYCVYFEILRFYSVFILLSFCISSYITSFFYYQPFQFFLSISLFFVSLGLILYIINYISLLIFLAFLVLGVLILLVKFLTLK